MFHYKLLPHLPLPPQWIIDQVDFNLQPSINNIGERGTRTLTNWRGYTGPAIINTLRRFSDDYTTWIKENITDNFHSCMVNYALGSPEMQYSGAHTDFTRDYLLLYNLRTGGPDAKVLFWQEKDQPLIRDRRTEVGTLDNLVEIDRVGGPENTWYLINTRILHGAENITEPRINLQISFDDRLPVELL